MKRVFYLFGAFILILGVSTAANAVLVTYDYGISGGTFVSTVSGVITETFNNAVVNAQVPVASMDQAWSWSGTGAVVSGSSVGEYAPPFGPSGPDPTKYMTVPFSNLGPPNTVTAALGGTYNYFGLWWGSVDTSNTLDFYLNNVLVQSYTGPMLAPPGNGSWTDPAQNLYVNFFFGAQNFDTVSFTSEQKAFEFDNVSVASGTSVPAVPIPPTAYLLGAGLLGLVGLRRRFKK